MNKLFIPFTALMIALSFGQRAAAQATICKIKYNYDAGGNRIKRYYGCDQTGPGVIDYFPDGVLSNLSPNPTTGPLTGTFTSPIGGNAGSATVSVVNVNGTPVLLQTFSQIASTFSIDISQQIPGTYFLTVYAFSKMETYTITKL